MPRALRVLVALVAGCIVAACASNGATPPSDTRSISPVNSSPAAPPPVVPSAATESPSAATESPSRSVDATAPLKGTGIAGTTVILVGCGVVRAEKQCPQRPVAASLSVLDSTGSVVATAESGSDGHFAVAVGPGQYTLRPLKPRAGPFNKATALTVQVERDRYTTVTVVFDNGVR